MLHSDKDSSFWCLANFKKLLPNNSLYRRIHCETFAYIHDFIQFLSVQFHDLPIKYPESYRNIYVYNSKEFAFVYYLSGSNWAWHPNNLCTLTKPPTWCLSHGYNKENISYYSFLFLEMTQKRLLFTFIPLLNINDKQFCKEVNFISTFYKVYLHRMCCLDTARSITRLKTITSNQLTWHWTLKLLFWKKILRKYKIVEWFSLAKKTVHFVTMM